MAPEVIKEGATYDTKVCDYYILEMICDYVFKKKFSLLLINSGGYLVLGDYCN